jgi:hypothetical protein
MGSKQDAVRLEMNAALLSKLPPGAMRAVDSVRAGIASGAIKIEPGRPFPPTS